MSGDIPVVTVVIPCFNMGVFIDETVKSVLAQSFRAYEIIIVDDGSDDSDTIRKLDELEKNGLTLLRSRNYGVAAARNKGIQMARGRYVLPLDADDILDPHFLEKAVCLLEGNPEIGIVSCDAELFGEVSGIRRLPEFSPERILSENLLFATAVFRKIDWQRAGGYCTSLKFGWEDWDFWISMAKYRTKVVRIPEALLKYRIRPDSRDRSMKLWQKGSMMLIILARHYKCYFRSPLSLIRLIINAQPRTAGRKT